MKKMPFFIILLVGAFCGVRAEDIYVTQPLQGADTGTNCSNAHSIDWLNDTQHSFPVNWGSGANQIGPGDTVHFCGTITTTVNVLGSGVQRSPITLFFEPNARISLPASSTLYLNGHSWIIIDGGTKADGSPNGILENTQNGTGLTFQKSNAAIYAAGSSNFEVKHLLMQNFYIHSSVADDVIDQSLDNCVYANDTSGTISIHDNVMHDVGWCLKVGQSGNANVAIYNNDIYNVDHGIAIASGPGAPITADIHHNRFHDFGNWDTTSNAYHHDGIHYYGDPGNVVTMNIYNNIFDGNWGIHNTSYIFLETPAPSVAMYNNVFLQSPETRLNNGFVVATGNQNVLYNNTVVGAGLVNSGGLFLGGTGMIFKNNVITGVTTFIAYDTSGTGFGDGGLDSNIYAAAVPGGNPPFAYRGMGVATLAAWKSVTDQDSHSTGPLDPQIDAMGRPKAGSPLIGAGSNLNSLCRSLPNLCQDYNGNTRPQTDAWDIGAYQYCPNCPTGTPTPTPTPTTPPTGTSADMQFLPFKNVFNPTKEGPMMIKYTLNGTGATLKIYDRQGNEINTLADGTNMGSFYQTEWNGRNSQGSVVASGTYILLLKQGGTTVKKKVAVIK